ncbi:hypothetical protein KKB99_03375 [bacterium]|nr:hypothetical protein [bacterium]MBU1025032.1 hypothetical protein [bacterium]
MSDDNNKSKEIPLEETVSIQPKQDVERSIEAEETEFEDVVAVKVDGEHEGDYDLSDEQDNDKNYDRDRDNRRGGYRAERSRNEPSFEEKMRSFKKQSEERLLHIRRSREAKIGKKRTR